MRCTAYWASTPAASTKNNEGKTDGRRRPINGRTNRILRHGSPASPNAMESLSKGRLKVAAEAIMTDNSTSSFADKREK